MELKPYADAASFVRDAATVWTKAPEAANLQWALADGYRQDGKAPERAFVVRNHEEIRLVGLQTDPDRPLIIFRTAPLTAEMVGLIYHYFPQPPGLICDESDQEILLERFGPPKKGKLFRMYRYVLTPDLLQVEVSPGLRPATLDDLDLLAHWVRDFLLYIEELGGGNDYRGKARRLIEGKKLYVFERDGRPVTMVGSTRHIGGVACVNHVFTPENFRGRGYATLAVAAFSEHLLQSANACVLFADKANPASNAVYQKIGYRIDGEDGVCEIDYSE